MPRRLERRLARAQEGDLTAGLEEARQPFQDEVESLLSGQAGDHGDEHGAIGLEPQIAAKGLAAERLVLGLPGGVMTREGGILRGIPGLVVDPVDHAVEVGASVLEDALEPVAEGRGADLRRVRPTHGGEEIGEGQPPFEEIDLAVELDARGGEEVPAEAGHGHVVVPEHALVGELVNGEERAQPTQLRSR